MQRPRDQRDLETGDLGSNGDENTGEKHRREGILRRESSEFPDDRRKANMVFFVSHRRIYGRGSRDENGGRKRGRKKKGG